MENAFGILQSVYFPPPPARNRRGFSFDSSLWKLGRWRAGQSVRWVLGTVASCSFSLSCESTTSNLINYHFNVHTPLFLQVNWSCLCNFLYSPPPPGFGWKLVLQPQFSNKSKNSHWFPLCSAFFLIVRTGVMISKLFACLSWNGKSRHPYRARPVCLSSWAEAGRETLSLPRWK